jgi:hypothetical protein
MCVSVLLGVAFVACADPFEKFTHHVTLQSEPLPPGVRSEPDTFRAQIAFRTPGTAHHHQRLGKCSGFCLVEVTIAPLGDTREINPKYPPIPASGRAVAKILNLDSTYAEDMYGFRPSALFEYYVWADTAASHARMTLLEVPAVGQPGSVHAIFQKTLGLCHLDPSPPTDSDADFRWCFGITASTPEAVNQATVLPIEPFLKLASRAFEKVFGSSTLEAAIWLRCKDGCCG